MIEVKNLSKIYKGDKEDTVALNKASFKLDNKGMVFVVGKSGCGKTTLLNIIGGLDSFTSGDVYINQRALSSFSIQELDNYRNNTIGFVFQDFCLINSLNVYENIKLSVKIQNSKKKINYKKLLDDVGLGGLGYRFPRQLSAGQKQRVAIARSIVKDPSVILADEPTGNVDENTSCQIMDLLKEISKERLVIIVSHNLEEAYKYADRIIEMSDGNIVSDKFINESYLEESIISSKETILPYNANISNEELSTINKYINESNGDYVIKQSEDKFISCDKEFDLKETKLAESKMSFLSMLKYSQFFFVKKLFFNLFIVILITFVTSIFSIVQNIGYTDSRSEMYRVLNEKDINYIPIYSASNITNRYNNLDVKYLDEKCATYGSEYIDLYNLGLTLSSGTTTNMELFNHLSLSVPNTYVYQSSGLHITDLEGFKKVNGDCKLLAGDYPYTGSAVLISDYFADCIIFYSKGVYKTYEDIVNAKYINKKLKISGVFETGFYAKNKDNLKKHLNYKSGVNGYMLDAIFKYSIMYSFNVNFFEDYQEFQLENNIGKLQAYSVITDYNSQSSHFNTGKISFSEDLSKDEIWLSYSVYNMIYSGIVSSSKPSKFVPIDISLSVYDQENNQYFSRDFKVTKIFSVYDTYHNFIMNEDYYGDLLAYNKSIMLLNTFKTVFKFISVLVMASLLFVILLNASTIIKHNTYEIGLMRAFGAKTRELVIIFAIHMIMSSVMVCVLLFMYASYCIDMANDMLCAGIGAYLNSNFNANLITLRPVYFIVNVCFISGFTIFSTIVPIIRIKKIEPLKIIKARN